MGVLRCETVAGFLVVPVEKTRQANVKFLDAELMKVITVDCAEGVCLRSSGVSQAEKTFRRALTSSSGSKTPEQRRDVAGVVRGMVGVE